MPEYERQEALVNASSGLPSVTSFATLEIEDDNGVIDYSVDTTGLIRGLNEDFLKTELFPEQLAKFGFKDMKELSRLHMRVKENLLLGMKLFFLLEPVYKVNSQLDASCCAILFCKAMELQMKDCFIKDLKEILPDYKVRGVGRGRNMIPLKDAREEEFTLGTFNVILSNQGEKLGRRMKKMGKGRYDEAWWSSFEDKLSDCKNRRNKCCHSGLFTWEDQSFLLFDMFLDDTEKHERTPKIGGILFESKIGKELDLSGVNQV